MRNLDPQRASENDGLASIQSWHGVCIGPYRHPDDWFGNRKGASAFLRKHGRTCSLTYKTPRRSASSGSANWPRSGCRPRRCDRTPPDRLHVGRFFTSLLVSRRIQRRDVVDSEGPRNRARRSVGGGAMVESAVFFGAQADNHRCANGSSDAVGTTVETAGEQHVETQAGQALNRLSRTLEGNKAHGRRA